MAFLAKNKLLISVNDKVRIGQAGSVDEGQMGFCSRLADENVR